MTVSGAERAALVPHLVLACLAGAAPADAAPATGERFALSRPGDHLWRWATVERRMVARAAPARRARRVAAVHVRTPEGTPELLPLLERRARGGRLWIRVRLPVLPNGTTGWVPRRGLGAYRTARTRLVVDTRTRVARLRRHGRTIVRARVGVGRPRWPTPRGVFIVRNRLTHFSDPLYGPLAFGTSARSAVLTDWPGGGFVGIHGTDQPWLIPGRVSHGCIRLRNRDLLRLARRMPVGTVVRIV